MSKPQPVQIVQFLAIIGFCVGLGAAPSIADALAATSIVQADAQPMPLTTVHSLGTIDAQDVNIANTQNAALQPVHAGNITYVTGGIGDDERNALEAMKPNYNLRILNTSKTGEYVGDTQLTLLDRQGDTLLTASSGPIFLAELPPGTYRLTANSDGRSQTRELKMNKTTANSLRLNWY